MAVESVMKRPKISLLSSSSACIVVSLYSWPYAASSFGLQITSELHKIRCVDKGVKKCNMGQKQNQSNDYLRVVMTSLSLGIIHVHWTIPKDDNSGHNHTENSYKPTENSVPVCMSSLLQPCKLISQLQDTSKFTHWVKNLAVFVIALSSNTHSLALINTHLRTW